MTTSSYSFVQQFTYSKYHLSYKKRSNSYLTTEYPYDNTYVEFLCRILFWFPKYDTMSTFTRKTCLGTRHCLHVIFFISFVTKIYLNNKSYKQ